MGGGVEGACRRTESANPASVPLQGMGQQLVATGALLVEAVFEQMSPLIFGSEASLQISTCPALDRQPEQSVKENPHYQKWMGSVSNSLCGICSQPAGISSYVAACKHLFHRHCLEACQSALRCEFCKRLVSVSFEQTSELCTAADPEQALRDAILACSAKHDKKLNRKTQE